MLLYLIVIVITYGLVAGLNIIFHVGNHPWWYYLVFTLGACLVVFLLDALVAIIIRRMPEKWMNYKKKLFYTSDKEIKFYQAIKVNKWKDKVPELGGFTNFHKDKVERPFDDEYIKRFILEACYGIAIHIYSVPASFLVLLCDYNIYMGGSWLWLTICLPVAVVNAILIVLPAFILKFNLPRLIRIHENNLLLEERKKQKALENGEIEVNPEMDTLQKNS